MAIADNPFLTRSFLRSVWGVEYQLFKDSDDERNLLDLLNRWSKRRVQKETSAEASFIAEFFEKTWGYRGAGQGGTEGGFTLYPKFAIAGAGQAGGRGESDLAMGWFGRDDVPDVPQVICEFKDIKSGLDVPQRRKANDRSPVKQCLDYLAGARRGLFGNESVLPTWGIVTDMREFRLYWYDRAPQQFLRFVISSQADLFSVNLLNASEESRFERFIFWKVFRAETLLTSGGRAVLARLIERQGIRDREIEDTFYAEYRTLRERLYKTLLLFNRDYADHSGREVTKGQFVRLAQKLLDRIIFVAFCEDMGQALSYPPKLFRDFLSHQSQDPYYDSRGTDIWSRVRALFDAMNQGLSFGGQKIQMFNGGLFASDPLLDGLHIPNMIFCEKNQGQSEAMLKKYPETVLYIVGVYNFASQATARQSISLYTLGHIFEQSTTELEILEAEAENRPSLNKISKRKRDGVYYTPEWIVAKIVRETLDPRLTELRTECGWVGDQAPDLKAIDAYEARLSTFTVCDPACGSGAFLITAVRYLFDEFHVVRAERARLRGPMTATTDGFLFKQILGRNIYGVDINPASVELAKLALWLHTARDKEPLSSLDHTIRCGNSLIDSAFFKERTADLYADPEQRERINSFDWWHVFPEIRDRGGFDVVVGNPPYVKLQNFRQVHGDVAEFLKAGTSQHRYVSTQTGNFDLYLPFIERGLELLNDQGRLGYIAPSLWAVNEYGAGLRNLVRQTQKLERWVDFKGFQVFEEAITYTALQFFTAQPNENIKVSVIPDGNVADVDWKNDRNDLPYESLPIGKSWIMAAGEERALIDRLAQSCKRLDDPAVTTHVFQGLITGADEIFHLKKLARGRYLCSPRGKGAAAPYEVLLEDELMKPLVSGAEAKRYIVPDTDTYVLFPYDLSLETPKLFNQAMMQLRYPNSWTYLRSFCDKLRFREYTEERKKRKRPAPFDDDDWYRFGRNQNLDKQTIPKLVVAQTVPDMRVFFDSSGEFFLNNVRVNGIVPAGFDPWYLLAVLNGPVANFVFKRIAAPKAGGYFEANRQFIAPLPIPNAARQMQRKIGSLARRLQKSTTERSALTLSIEKRLGLAGQKRQPMEWLFPDVGTAAEWEAKAPAALDSEQRLEWADLRRLEAIEAKLDELDRRLRLSSKLGAELRRGELCFLVDEVVVVDSVFVAQQDAAFLLAQWQFVALKLEGSGGTGEELSERLRKVAVSGNAALRDQIVALVFELSEVQGKVVELEAEINELLYGLYNLKADERLIVGNGGRKFRR